MPLSIPFLDVIALSMSTFWGQADALCRNVDAIAAVDAIDLGGLADDRDALVDYCKTARSPRFAARTDPERIATLIALARAAKLELPALQPPSRKAVSGILVAAAERQLSHEKPPELGLVGEKILATAVGALCERPEARAVLVQTCALSRSTVSLAALRTAVLQDLVGYVVDAVADRLPPSIRLLAASLAAPDVRSLDLPRSFGIPCGTGCKDGQRAISIAMRVAGRILADGAELNRAPDHYRYIVEEIVRTELASAEVTLDETQKTAVDGLVLALRALDEPARLGLDAPPNVLVERQLAIVLSVVDLSVSLSVRIDPAATSTLRTLAASYRPAVAATLAISDAIARADAKEAVYRATQALETAGAVSPGAERALRAAADLSMARTESDLKAAVRNAVLPLPPWIDRIVFDLNLAPPIDKNIDGRSELSLNGDITFGYNGDHLGFVAHADSSYYDLAAASNSALTERYTGSLDGWGLVALGKTVRLEPRLALGANYYGTLASDTTADGNRQTNQDSIFLRAVGSLGVRVQPGDRFAFAGSFGVGWQYEDYYQVIQTSRGEQGTTFNVATTARYEARLRAQWSVWPRVLSIRARGDLQAFDTRRQDQAITYLLGRTTLNQQGITEISQLEIFARGFLDLDLLRFFGFVPSAHAGANVFRFAENGTGSTVVVPVAGIGIRREAL